MLMVLLAATRLWAQPQAMHYRHHGDNSPGAIGNWQLQRGGPLPGFFQPVEIKAPQGALVSLALEGHFDEPQPAPVLVGMLISPVYRLRVSQIPHNPGYEVFPTIEVIDRTYAPVGQQRRFPIEIELTQEDLELALAGKFVTRVIYLEDPESALPIHAEDGRQHWFEAGAGDDPLEIADGLGRPVAILRMGGRIPLADDGSVDQLPGGTAPLIKFRSMEELLQQLEQGEEVVVPEAVVPTSGVRRAAHWRLGRKGS